MNRTWIWAKFNFSVVFLFVLHLNLLLVNLIFHLFILFTSPILNDHTCTPNTCIPSWMLMMRFMKFKTFAQSKCLTKTIAKGKQCFDENHIIIIIIIWEKKRICHSTIEMKICHFAVKLFEAAAKWCVRFCEKWSVINRIFSSLVLCD